MFCKVKLKKYQKDVREKQISDSEIICNRNPRKLWIFFHRKIGLYKEQKLVIRKQVAF